MQQPDVNELLSEPLSLAALAGFFDVHRTKIRPMLDRLDGVVPLGNRWRVPVRHLPPRYWIEAKLIIPARVELSRRVDSCRFS